MRDRLLLAALIGLILLIADLGLFSIADAALAAIVLSLFFRHLAVYILILIGTVQDTPGLAGAWWYVGFVGVGCVVIVQAFIFTNLQSKPGWATPKRLTALAIGLVMYALMVSFFSESWLGLSQSVDRPYAMVGGLIIFNVVSAYFSFQLLARQEVDVVLLRLLLSMILGHTAFVVLMQVIISPSFLSSSLSAFDFEGSGQLATITGLGFARVTGTYATPNGFALVMALVLFLWLASYERSKVPSHFILLFVVCVLGVSLLSLSKAMLAFSFFCVAALIFFVGVTSLISRSIALFLALISLLLFGDLVFNDTLLTAFRFTAIDWEANTYRNIAWRAVLNNFEPFHWIAGTGLSYWPAFFENAVGFALADPHTWIFSYAGTFGLPGVLFFAYVLWSLASAYFKQSASGKALVLCLAGLLLVKDAVSIPYLLGNTPLTWFIWMLIFHVCNESAQSAMAVQGRRRPGQRTGVQKVLVPDVHL